MHATSFLSTFVVFSLAFLIQSSSAGVTFENPRGKSKWTGGKMNAIKWKESGNGSTLAALGTVTASLHAGSNMHTTFLADLGTAQATDLKLVAKIPADVGPDGKTYYINFVGSNGESFQSQKFTLEKMSGQFNTSLMSTIHQQDNTNSSSIPATSAADISGAAPLSVGSRPSSAAASTTSSVKSSASTRIASSMLASSALLVAAAWLLL